MATTYFYQVKMDNQFQGPKLLFSCQLKVDTAKNHKI